MLRSSFNSEEAFSDDWFEATLIGRILAELLFRSLSEKSRD